MTYEEVKDILHKYLKLLQLVKLKEQHLQTARECMGDIKSIDCSKLGGGRSTQPQSCVERAVERVDRIECDYMQFCEKLFDVEDKIAEMLPSLNEDEQVLIIERYMKGVSIRQLRDKYYYSEKHIYKKLSSCYRKLSSGY